MNPVAFITPKRKPSGPATAADDFFARFAIANCWVNTSVPPALRRVNPSEKIQNLDHQRMRYDSIALSLAVLPMLIYYLTFITAPMALFVAIRYWNAPPSLVGQNRVRYIAAILVALPVDGGLDCADLLPHPS